MVGLVVWGAALVAVVGAFQGDHGQTTEAGTSRAAQNKKPPTTTPPNARVGPASFQSGQYTVLAWNDLGMHCINPRFGELCILPPYNNFHATVVRRGDDPQIIESGVTVSYSIPGNTHSVGKTDFWTYAPALFGVTLKPNIGLTGNGLAGHMQPTGNNDWGATGIPITPITDKGQLNAYQLAQVDVKDHTGKMLARTMNVMPVSWEINCNVCHKTPGITTETDILLAHDRLHGTNLEAHRPVLCASCHADPALGTTGVAGLHTMSAAMHGAHAPRVDTMLPNTVNKCYACHPGFQTNCQRDVHLAKGITCTQCHGTMYDVGNTNRTPWVDEPTCASCHQQRKPSFGFEQSGKLYKQSLGHHGIPCSACHGSPHALTPAVTAPDNAQSIALQGFAGPIRKCTVCHTRQPDDPFDHNFGEGGGTGTGGGGDN
jgi:hypothetical protein